MGQESESGRKGKVGLGYFFLSVVDWALSFFHSFIHHSANIIYCTHTYAMHRARHSEIQMIMDVDLIGAQLEILG